MSERENLYFGKFFGTVNAARARGPHMTSDDVDVEYSVAEVNRDGTLLCVVKRATETHGAPPRHSVELHVPEYLFQEGGTIFAVESKQFNHANGSVELVLRRVCRVLPVAYPTGA
jgi:hypothetical protein